MAKSKTTTYVLTLALKTEKFQEDIINKRLEIARNIYNSVLGKVMNRYKLMLESKEYRNIKKKINFSNKSYYECDIKKLKTSLNKNRKELYKILTSVYINYGLTQYSLYEDVKPMYKHFKNNIGSLEARAIADRVWSAIDKLINGNGDKVHFKKYGELNSIENKCNNCGLRYQNDKITWDGLIISIVIKSNDVYAQKAIQDRIKYCRILRKLIRGKYKYYVQLVMEGIPPNKYNRETGEIKRDVGSGNVGLDIGTRTLAISSKNDVKLLELCPEVENIQNIITKLSRKLDRQKRSNNPNNFNENGTIKCGIMVDGKKTKLIWVKSNKYIKTQYEISNIQRKQACIRKQSHEKLANYIISLGERVLVETMQFAGLQKRSKNTTVNAKTGKFNKKKRFGKSLANKAPSMLIEIINRKLKYSGLEILKINTQKVKASQYNHFTDEYNKKALEDRWNKDIKIQRDCYSAFLIMNVNNDLESINKKLCDETYNNFKTLHDKEIERLKELKLNGVKLISSMGI